MRKQFSNVFSLIALCDFYKKNSWISLYCKFCLWTPRRRFAVSADVSSVCDVVYEEQRLWSGVLNQTAFRMCGAEPYQFEPLPAQKEERSASTVYYIISSKNIHWHSNSVLQCWDPDLLTISLSSSWIWIMNNEYGLWIWIHLKSSVEKQRKWRFWKISSFVRVIGFGFIPNIRKIDNKVEEEERKKDKNWPNNIFFLVELGFERWPLTWMLFWL